MLMHCSPVLLLHAVFYIHNLCPLHVEPVWRRVRCPATTGLALVVCLQNLGECIFSISDMTITRFSAFQTVAGYTGGGLSLVDECVLVILQQPSLWLTHNVRSQRDGSLSANIYYDQSVASIRHTLIYLD